MVFSCLIEYHRTHVEKYRLVCCTDCDCARARYSDGRIAGLAIGERVLENVKANDLEKYRALWHEDFLGWPFVSSVPVRKDHITDWIIANTSNGSKLRSYSIEQLAIQVTGKIAINYYRIRANWANEEGAEAKTDALRIMHTWIRTGGSWQIIGGMSAPVNANGQ
jgi:ketosteroid isomerase-like protein